VIEEVQAWHHRAASTDGDRRAHRRLLVAAKARFGGWRNALVAAGILGPDEYPKWGRKWTEQRVIEAIQDRHVRGLSLKVTDDFKLSQAATRWFGSWHTALTAAGVAVPRKKHRPPRAWTTEHVIQEIHRRWQEGVEMRTLRRTDSGLAAAARRHFGTWRRALSAAGLETKPRQQWSCRAIVAAIAAHRDQGTAQQIWKIDKSLLNAGAKYFGSWREALRAAGLRPRYRRWSKADILQELRARYRRSQYNLSVVIRDSATRSRATSVAVYGHTKRQACHR
jgi:hypothetical protein